MEELVTPKEREVFLAIYDHIGRKMRTAVRPYTRNLGQPTLSTPSKACGSDGANEISQSRGL